MLATAGFCSAQAQDSGNLAQQAQNPIANLISVPFQNNTNFNVGRLDNDQNILNIQPVIPFKLNEDWNLVTRWILPVVYQPPLFQGDDTDFGLGDFNPSFFFVNQVNPKLMIGAGPTFLLPTSTDRRLGPDKWGAGPTAAIVWTPGKWVVGALVNNIWSFAGSDQRSRREPVPAPVLRQLQPGARLVPHLRRRSSPPTGPKTQTISGSCRSAAAWAASSSVGAQPVNMSLQAYDNVITPDGGADWQLRFQVQLLFPTGG